MLIKKKYLILFSVFFTFFFFDNLNAQQIINFDKLNGTHDLSLPDWGPYTKRYIGISHIPRKESGIRFDLSVFPGFYRRKVAVPDVLFENDYHPWETSPNLEYFSFRHELEWKDDVYTDISYSEISENSRLIRMECVNNTDNNQNLVLHFMASVNFPPIREYSPYTSIYPSIITLPKKSVWFDALDYEDLQFANPKAQDNLVYDGKMRAEIREDGFVNGSGIADNFGVDVGDFVKYKFTIEHSFDDAELYIRYRISGNSNNKFEAKGLLNSTITFDSTDVFSSKILNIGELNSGKHEIKLTSLGDSKIELDGFSIIEKESADEINIKRKEWNHVPKIIEGPIKNSLLIKYDDIEGYYGLLWDYDLFEIREWNTRDIGEYFKQMSNEHVQTSFKGEGDGHFTNVFMKPIELNQKSKKVIYGAVCYGEKEEVEQSLLEIESDSSNYDKIYLSAKYNVPDFSGIKEGEKYKFGVERLNATLNSNVVYPVYTQKDYIKHSAPGRWWDCLYTWDSGFIGLGLLQTDIRKAIENLNVYLLAPGSQSAFIHHGSPVPVQFYLFLELWNKTQSKELLEYFYPRLKQYHEFLAGRLGSSTTNSLNSNLLKTWDYFYNSGGWDDYPPQKYTHDQLLEESVTPVINTAHAIRTAKILKMAAQALDKEDDITAYNKDIEIFSQALQEYSWDEDAGYFSYVVHDKDENPLEHLKYEDGTNYNMGLDGAYPLVSGICNEVQANKIISSLKSEEHIWSKVGLSAVDQSAPYFKIDGYWNGTVWMPHQWFFWKTMLDLGEADFAFKIAKTALDAWKLETEASYNSMEHFLIETGRGAGWHEFGGLSSPILIWYSAYFLPGNFNAGFDVWVDNKKWSDDLSDLSVSLKNFGNKLAAPSLIACMNPEYDYIVKWNGKVINHKTIVEGTLSIDILFADENSGVLEIQKK